jgi:hypothetical protein
MSISATSREEGPGCHGIPALLSIPSYDSSPASSSSVTSAAMAERSDRVKVT